MRTGEELWIVIVLCSIALAYFAWRIRLWRSRFKWSRNFSRIRANSPGKFRSPIIHPARPMKRTAQTSASGAVQRPLGRRGRLRARQRLTSRWPRWARSPLWQGLTRKSCTQFKSPLPNNCAAWIPSATTSKPTFMISLRRAPNHGCSAWRTTSRETPSRSDP